MHHMNSLFIQNLNDVRIKMLFDRCISPRSIKELKLSESNRMTMHENTLGALIQTNINANFFLVFLVELR